MTILAKHSSHVFALIAAIGLSGHAISDPLLPEGQCNALERKLDVEIAKNQFLTTRGFAEYLNEFGEPLALDMVQLGPTDHWIDLGCGEGIAVARYLSPIEDGNYLPEFSTEANHFQYRLRDRPLEKKAKVTGITFKTVTNDVGVQRLVNSGNLTLKTGRYFEDIPTSEIEKANVITDFYGVFAYTRSIDVTLKKSLDLLKDNGSLYIFLGHFKDVNLSHFKTVDGKELDLVQWLSSIPGIKVELITGNGNFSAKKLTIEMLAKFMAGGRESVRITITDRAAIRVPELKLVDVYTDQSGNFSPVPVRTFVERNSRRIENTAPVVPPKPTVGGTPEGRRNVANYDAALKEFDIYGPTAKVMAELASLIEIHVPNLASPDMILSRSKHNFALFLKTLNRDLTIERLGMNVEGMSKQDFVLGVLRFCLSQESAIDFRQIINNLRFRTGRINELAAVLLRDADPAMPAAQRRAKKLLRHFGPDSAKKYATTHTSADEFEFARDVVADLFMQYGSNGPSHVARFLEAMVVR